VTNLLTKREVAERLRVTVKTVDRWRKTGTFPKGFRVGYRVLWHQDELDEFIRSRGDGS